MAQPEAAPVAAWVVYVIRQKSTGLFLPCVHSKFTQYEPVAGLPRLFEKKTSAKLALAAWANGPWEQEYEVDWTGSWTKVGTRQARHKTRDKGDMEVVDIEVRVRGGR